MSFAQFLEWEFLDNTLWQWSLATALALTVIFVTLFARRIVRSRYERLAKTDGTEILEIPLQIAARTHFAFLCVLALYAGSTLLDVSESFRNTAIKVATIAAFWQVGLWATTAAWAWIDLKRRKSIVADRAAAGSLSIIGVVLRALIWSVVLLLTLDNLGVNITTLVAGLGIGGVAIALAVQNVLGDLLASLSITLDKPFVVGDFLIVGDFLGSVEYIGIKSTRLRSLSGEQIVMSNADLLSSRVRNYGRMQERRVVFNLKVALETPSGQVETIPALLREIVTQEENVRYDRGHFAKFDTSALDFEVVYYVLSADYNRYMDTQQRINIAILKKFAERGIAFAYPTQKLWLEKVAVDPAAANGHAHDDSVSVNRRDHA